MPHPHANTGEAPMPLRDVLRHAVSVRRVAIAGLWLAGSALWAVALVRHFFVHWPHRITSPGMGDLFERLKETGTLLHGGDPYVIGKSISDNVPPSVSLLHVPLYLSGHMGAALVASWLSCASMSLIMAVGLTQVTSVRRGHALIGATVLTPPVLGLCFYPTVAALVAGQDQLWFMALVVLDLFVVSRWRRGVLVGAVAGFSLWPAIFAVLVILDAGWRSIRRLAAGFIATVVLGALLSLSESWRYWTYLVPSGQVTSRGVNSSAPWPGAAFGLPENYSLNGLISRAPLGGSLATKGVYYALFVLIIACGLAIAWGLWRLDLPMSATVVLAIAAVESTPFAWVHHWVWVLLLLPFAALETWGRHRVLSCVLWLSIVPFERQLSARIGHRFSPTVDGAPVLHSWFNVMFLNRYQLAGMVVLLGAAVLVLRAAPWRTRSLEPASSEPLSS